MNIVIINDNAQINGGASKVAIFSARDLADRGHKIFFLCAVPPIAPELSGHPRITILSSEQHEILTDPNRIRAFAQGWWNLKAKRLADNLFAQLDPQDTVVHFHLWAKALSSSVARAAISAGFPVVCTLHDFLLACPTGTLFNHPKERICHLRPMSLSCIGCNCDTRSYGHKMWRVGRQMIQRQFGMLPAGIHEYIVHSHLVAQIMKPNLPADALINYVPVYIESTQAEPASPADHDTFVYLGRLVREKGVLMLARAAKEEGIGIMFVGGGALEGEIATENPAATITGWVNHEQSVQCLRRCRALVFPSLWYETLGLVVLEAAAQGIASIVPDTSAAREIVLDGVTGLHFKHGDELDLRRQMRCLLDPELARNLGRAAYERFWSSDFASRKGHFESLEAVYRATLARKKKNSQRFTSAAWRQLHDLDA